MKYLTFEDKMNPVPVNCSRAESVQHRVAVAVQESFCRSEIVRMCDSQAGAGEWPALLRQLCSPPPIHAMPGARHRYLLTSESPELRGGADLGCDLAGLRSDHSV